MSRALYLEGEFRPRATIRGGILMFQAADAIALIREAHHRRIRVLGIDTFRLADGATEPMLQHMLDLSAGGQFSDAHWQAAETFVQERSHMDFHFEVVLADEVETRGRDDS